MIVDSSALLAILLDEPERDVFARKIAEAPVRLLSAANYLECGIVADGSPNPAKGSALDPLVAELDIAIEPVTAEQAQIAGGVPRLRQGPAPGGTELRRPLRSCARPRDRRAAAVQGRRFRQDRQSGLLIGVAPSRPKQLSAAGRSGR